MSATTPIEWTNATWNPLIAWLKEPIVAGHRKIPAGTRGWFCTKCSDDLSEIDNLLLSIIFPELPQSEI
jgi:hypothetical protein